MTSTNYMQRFVSETVINECLEAYDTMNRYKNFLSTREGRLQKRNRELHDAAAYKFFNKRSEREVVKAIQHTFDWSDASDNFQDSISDEHKLVLFRMMTRMIEDGSLQLNTSA
tara:strand:- start:581 stop:919 length:339 start_codon:yes stop_codon:yes gene_type:complete